MTTRGKRRGREHSLYMHEGQRPEWRVRGHILRAFSKRVIYGGLYTTSTMKICHFGLLPVDSDAKYLS